MTVPGWNAGGSKILRTHPELPWCPPSLLYKGYGVFPGVKRPGRGVGHSPPCSAKVMKSRPITLLPFWAFMACSRVNLSFTFTHCIHQIMRNYICITLRTVWRILLNNFMLKVLLRNTSFDGNVTLNGSWSMKM